MLLPDLGGMGGAQPLAITMNEGTCLAAEMEEWRVDKRIQTRYLDEKFSDLIKQLTVHLKQNKKGKLFQLPILVMP
jgi:urocanate hydratase